MTSIYLAINVEPVAADFLCLLDGPIVLVDDVLVGWGPQFSVRATSAIKTWLSRATGYSGYLFPRGLCN